MEEQELNSPRMELKIEPDNMSAAVILRGRYDAAIGYDTIIDLMNDYKIVFGTDTSALNKALDKWREDQSPDSVQSAVVARGQPSQSGKDGKIEYFVKEAAKVAIDEDGRADFRNIERYQTVDKGQLLARRIPPEHGTPGIDIFGNEVPAPEPFNPKLVTGENVSEVPGSNEYIARIHGVYVRGEGRIDVNPVLQVPGNVGLESGNVNYDGNVQIGGNIERGSVVSCLGDCVVGGIIESGQIRVGGSLTARKGINTRKDENVQVAGDLSAVYIENSRITVDGVLIAQNSIIQSNIIGYSDVSAAGSGARITGGEIITHGSVSSGIIGNQSETRTKIMLGFHYKNMQYYKLHMEELKDVEKKFLKIQDDIEKIKIYVQRARGKIPLDKKAAFRVKFNEYKEIQELKRRLQTQVKTFLAGRYNKNEVRLTAREVIYPGVEIHYRGSVEKITAPQTKVVFRFIPGEEKPVMEAYKPS